MVFRGVANSSNDMRGIQWLPIAAGIGFFIYAIVNRNKKGKPTIGYWISLTFVCGAMVLLGIWSYLKT